MVCPACGNTWEARRDSCPRCGFSVRETLRTGKTQQPANTWQGGTFSGNAAPVLPFEHSPRSKSQESRPFLPGPQEKPPRTGVPAEPFSASLQPPSQSLPRSSSAPLHPVSRPLATGAESSLSSFQGLQNQGSKKSAPLNDAPSFPEKRALPPLRQLLPGALLQGGRYRIEELVERQNWLAGAFEATWIGYDLQEGQQVMICEVLVPGGLTPPTVSIMRTAALTLASIRRYPHIVPILAAFSDQGRGFFIFEPPAGEPLLARLRRLQHPLPEAEVVELCLQICDVLEALEQKSPVLVHGLIRPEHIYLSPDGSRYLLSNFSLLTAGKATHYLAGEGRSHLSPYTAPEFAQGIIDGRNDLYALVATAYHLVTGVVPLAAKNVIPHARSINTAVSPAFNAVLTKGLHFVPHQRYQHPSQLRQELLEVRAQMGQERFIFPGERSLAASSSLVSGHPAFTLAGGTAGGGMPFPFTAGPAEQGEDEDFLLPLPEMLPPMQTGNDRLEAALVLIGILLGLGGVTLLSNFHV